MSTLQLHVARILDGLAKTAAEEIIKLFDSTFETFSIELSERQKEIDTLRQKLELVENERAGQNNTKGEVYFCRQCGIGFENVEFLEFHHMRNHTENSSQSHVESGDYNILNQSADLGSDHDVFEDSLNTSTSCPRDISGLDDADDTVILDDSGSSPSKRRKTDDDEALMIQDILLRRPGGEKIIHEYERTKTITDSTRRQMINILCAEMTEIYGTKPPQRVRESYARGIVYLFPHLKDPFTKNGYEHYYDAVRGTGYLAWRLKTIQRKPTEDRVKISRTYTFKGGPAVEREPFASEELLSEEERREALELMRHSSDEAAVKEKMRLTFAYRQMLVHDQEKSSDILSTFPRFLDMPGLIEQDFRLLFGENTAARFLERWPTVFKDKVVQQSKGLVSTNELEELIHNAESTTEEDIGWDSDMSSILLLLHLLPPSAQGRKKPGRMSASQAAENLVTFKRAGRSIEEHLESVNERRQPYILATGTKRSSIHSYFIVIDRHTIPCKATGSLGVFDELFKAHFVFGKSYCDVLANFYTFVQTTIYNIDIGKMKESPRVAELRARILH